MLRQLRRFLQTNLSVFSICLAFIAHSNAQVTEENGADFASQTIQIALSGEPPQLDYMKSTDMISFFVIEHIQEGLIRKDRRNRLAPGIAEKWEMNGSTVTFWLRDNALWSNGDTITAHDFVYAWRRVVDPNTASEYASIMFPIKNAELITKGEAPLESMGVKALDDFTLQVELESPTGYFFKLMTFGLFFPAQEEFVKAQNGRFGADVENLLFNGPFTLTSWIHGASLRMEKNLNYWDKANITLNAINIPYITPDSPARFNLFKDGKLAIEDGMLGLESEQQQNALDSRLRLRSESDGTVFWVEFNHRKERITRNKKLRKAMQLVFDSQELVNKVIGIAGYIQGRSMFPVWLDGVEDKFRKEYPVQPETLDKTKALVLIEEAKQELGVEQLPPIILLVDDRPISSLIAQYLQAHFKRSLNLDIRIDIQTFKQRVAKMQVGDFDMVVAGWGPDYEDPFTFGEYFASWNINNRGRYNNSNYDKLVRSTQVSANPQTRMDLMGEMQKIMVEDVINLPLYERSVSYVQNPKLRGVMIKMTGGSPVFTYAEVLE